MHPNKLTPPHSTFIASFYFVAPKLVAPKTVQLTKESIWRVLFAAIIFGFEQPNYHDLYLLRVSIISKDNLTLFVPTAIGFNRTSNTKYRHPKIVCRTIKWVLMSMLIIIWFWMIVTKTLSLDSNIESKRKNCILPCDGMGVAHL